MDKEFKSDEYWKRVLNKEQYRVCRKKGTEKPFEGALLHQNAVGTYACVCCEQALFSHKTKYDSGSGWPSFYDVLSEKNILLKDDTSLGMLRTEVSCARCHAHLGHVFEDGPSPTGKRYCINSVALQFKPE